MSVERVELRVIPGEEDPFEAFFRRQYPSAKRLAHLLSSGSPDAEDVVQEAFTAVHARFDRLDSPIAYLRTCVVNGVRQRHRRRAREQVRLRLVEPVGDTTPDLPEPMLDALATLPDRSRAALVLRYWLDLPDEEIGAILGLRRPSVRSLVHRALLQLRKEIER